MIELDSGKKVEKFGTDIMAAVTKQRELRLAGIGSTIWNDNEEVRSMYKNFMTGEWIVETPETTFEIV